LEDADVALLIVDVKDDIEEADAIFSSLSLKVPAIVVLNKTDLVNAETIKKEVEFFSAKQYCTKVMVISALQKKGTAELLQEIISLLPEGEPFYTDDNLSDLPMKFFVSELIREKIFYLFQDEIPYHATVLVQQFKEKTTLTKITADIIVQRETQKGIILGQGGKMIKELGTLARKDIEEFIGRKVFLELFVKVRPKWRDNEIFLREYGY
ncbi:MAG TPA: GTPase Era, partial [Hanamia sp.]